MRRFIVSVVCGLIFSGVVARGAADPMNAVAEKYAHLVLALGQHDPDYVDAFYGPTEWKTQAEKQGQSLDAIAAGSRELGAQLEQRAAKRKEVSGKPAEKSGSDM